VLIKAYSNTNAVTTGNLQTSFEMRDEVLSNASGVLHAVAALYSRTVEIFDSFLVEFSAVSHSERFLLTEMFSLTWPQGLWSQRMAVR
jgi:hypothetical protein